MDVVYAEECHALEDGCAGVVALWCIGAAEHQSEGCASVCVYLRRRYRHPRCHRPRAVAERYSGATSTPLITIVAAPAIPTSPAFTGRYSDHARTNNTHQICHPCTLTRPLNLSLLSHCSHHMPSRTQPSQPHPTLTSSNPFYDGVSATGLTFLTTFLTIFFFFTGSASPPSPPTPTTADAGTAFCTGALTGAVTRGPLGLGL